MFPKKILIIYLISFVVVFIGSAASPAPVLQRDSVLTQSDGSTFIATPYGDEWHNGYETKDGFTVLFDEQTSNWVYANMAGDGSLIKTNSVVNKGIPTMPEHLRPLLPREFKKMQVQGYDLVEGPIIPAAGNQRVLVILVQFANRTLVTTELQWSDVMFNGTAFSKVRHYFKEASYNNIDFVPALESYGTPNNGVVIVTLPYNHPNTAGNTGDTNRQITRDALIAADPYVDFAYFDTDSSGSLSTNELHIVIIVAGYETSYGGAASACSPSVWSHTGCLFELNPLTLDGEKVAACVSSGAYTQQGELHCSTSDKPGHMATIGAISHELGHSLWLPDEYDTDGSSNGIGNWGLMGTGSWNTCSGGYSGNCPSHPTAWDKWYLNWLTPIQIKGIQTVNVPDVTTSPTVYQLMDNPNGVDWSFQIASGAGEYFLAENRQRTGYNAGLPGKGLLIWHIWEGAPYSNSANQNEEGRRLIDLREADGLDRLDSKTNPGDAGDPFPGTFNNIIFDDTSNPNSKLYCTSGIGFCESSSVSITNISAPGPVMTVTLSSVDLVVTLYTPNGGEGIPSCSSYTIQWSAPPEAVKFDLKYSMSNGKTWNSIANGIEGTSYSWAVPTPTNNKKKCLLKVIGYDASGMKVGEDRSDRTFTIEIVKVTSPDGGEGLKSGNTWPITWQTNCTIRPVAKVKLFYSINGGTSWTLIKTLTGNPGSYNWLVPNVSSSSCKIKVVLKDAGGATVGNVVSNGFFTIQP